MSDYMIDCATKEEWAERALRAKAKLAKAVQALKKMTTTVEELADGYEFWLQDEDFHELLCLIRNARDTLAELKGETNAPT